MQEYIRGEKIMYMWDPVFRILSMEKTDYFLEYIKLDFKITLEIQTIARKYTKRMLSLNEYPVLIWWDTFREIIKVLGIQTAREIFNFSDKYYISKNYSKIVSDWLRILEYLAPKHKMVDLLDIPKKKKRQIRQAYKNYNVNHAEIVKLSYLVKEMKPSEWEAYLASHLNGQFLASVAVLSYNTNRIEFWKEIDKMLTAEELSKLEIWARYVSIDKNLSLENIKIPELSIPSPIEWKFDFL